MAYLEEVDTPKPQVAQPKKKKGASPAVRYYLILYNALSAIGWAYLLVNVAILVFNLDGKQQTTFPPMDAARALTLRGKIESALPPALVPLLRRAEGTYARVGWQTTVIQGCAALEILHVLFGFVRSSLVTTTMQVASRLWVLVGLWTLPVTHNNPINASMILAWSITETVRYSFFALSLSGFEPYPLLYVRYTLFYILYPIGASSEAFLTYSTLRHPALGAVRGVPQALVTYFYEMMFAIWWPGLYVMYTHMMKQRRKVLGSGRPGPKVKAS